MPPSCVDKFLPLILDMEEENVPLTPCFTDEGINYMHIRHNNLYRESAGVGAVSSWLPSSA